MNGAVNAQFIPYGTVVLLIEFKKTHWKEEAFVLWNEAIVYITSDTCDFGHDFDMNPSPPP